MLDDPAIVCLNNVFYYNQLCSEVHVAGVHDRVKWPGL